MCGVASQNRDYLFFHGFTRNVWSEVLRRNEQKYVRHSWAEELHEVINRCKGSSLAPRVGRLVFSVAVYCLQQERNSHIFIYRSRDVNFVVHATENYVKAKSRHLES